jgi:hypothetical protein
MKIYKKLLVMMETKAWHDLLPEEDIKFLEEVEAMSTTLISQVYIFIDLLQQYIQLIEQSSIFAPDSDQTKNDDMSNGPTQTFPAPPSNRAERRDKEKKLPFDKLKDIKK